MMRRSKSRAGLTLTELVIAVGMVGLLASLSIPGFITYQNRARRSEAFTNVGAIARSEKGYFAEQGIYFEAATHPATTAADLDANTRAWTSAAAAEFAELGWEPEGRVRFSYDVNTGSTGCLPCQTSGNCFTATAYGDLDVDDSVAAIVVVEPGTDPGSGTAVSCPPHLFSLGVPVVPSNEPVRHPLSDDF